VCELVGADVDQVRRAVASDRRIGPAFLFPGVGYGGSCFPKDVKAMVKFAGAKNYDFEILQAVEHVNERQKVRLFAKMKQHFGSLRGKRIAVWGLAFKPKTDDMREAPAIGIIKDLLHDGANVRAYDPVAKAEAMKVLPDITYADDEYTAVTGADALVFVTEWNQFRALDLLRMRDLMKSPKVADLRNIYEPEDMREMGFEYVGVGR